MYIYIHTYIYVYTYKGIDRYTYIKMLSYKLAQDEKLLAQVIVDDLYG